MKILFLNQEIPVEGNIKKISEHVVEISGTEQNLSGFHLLNSSGEVFGKYENYTTLYKVLSEGYQLSDDGSIHEDPYIPTLEEMQALKISEMNSAQQTLVQRGCEVELSDGSKETFTLTTNDQLSLNALSVKSLEGMNTLPWHPADETAHCKFYSEEDMKRITDTCMTWVTYHVTYFRDLRIYIRALLDKETIQNIQYGDEIPQEYQSEVLQMLLLQNGGVFA